MAIESSSGDDRIRARTNASRTNAYHDSQSEKEGISRFTKQAPDFHLNDSTVVETYDIICVGFGPASLAIAVALHDAAEAEVIGNLNDPQNQNQNQKPYSQLKIMFLEKQNDFAWHAGMLLPGTKMQISFIKDLATLRNPRSKFTFLNYLHEKGRLVPFTNLSTFLPQRLEYEDYMRWCAKKFEHLVSYGEEVIEVSSSNETGAGSGRINCFDVLSRNLKSNSSIRRRAKNAIIAVGGMPYIPETFPQDHPRVIHSSQFANVIPNLLSKQKSHKIAVIGAGQSAAEIFDYLMTEYPNSSTKLIIRSSTLRPSDDSPFVNEIFNPENVDVLYHQSSKMREASIVRDRDTNYSVVRLELLEKIYEHLYTQNLCASDVKSYKKNEILPYREVSNVNDASETTGGIRLILRNLRDNPKAASDTSTTAEEYLDVDLVLLASGYHRNAHIDILSPLNGTFVTDPISNVSTDRPKVERDYQVRFKEGAIADDAGIWLQGCNENTHGLSDTLLSILATRAGDVVSSIVSRMNK